MIHFLKKRFLLDICFCKNNICVLKIPITGTRYIFEKSKIICIFFQSKCFPFPQELCAFLPESVLILSCLAFANPTVMAISNKIRQDFGRFPNVGKNKSIRKLAGQFDATPDEEKINNLKKKKKPKKKSEKNPKKFQKNKPIRKLAGQFGATSDVTVSPFHQTIVNPNFLP